MALSPASVASSGFPPLYVITMRPSDLSNPEERGEARREEADSPLAPRRLH